MRPMLHVTYCRKGLIHYKLITCPKRITVEAQIHHSDEAPCVQLYLLQSLHHLLGQGHFSLFLKFLPGSDWVRLWYYLAKCGTLYRSLTCLDGDWITTYSWKVGFGQKRGVPRGVSHPFPAPLFTHCFPGNTT